MTEAFAARIYPTFLHVLELLERIKTGQGVPTPPEEQAQLKQLLQQIQPRRGDEREVELTRAALACWIDDVITRSGWKYAAKWSERPLSKELLGGKDRDTGFFDCAKEAVALKRPDLMETYFLCAAAGFRGAYSSDAVDGRHPLKSGSGAPAGASFDPEVTWSAAKVSASAIDLPATLEDWATGLLVKMAAPALRAFKPAATVDASAWDAAPLGGRRSLARAFSVLSVVVLLAVSLGIALVL